MCLKATACLALLLIAAPTHAEGQGDAAVAFGSRPSVARLRLSPDGKNVAYIVPAKGQGSFVLTLALTAGAKPKLALSSSGAVGRIELCDWVSNDRLVCLIYGLARSTLVRNSQYLPFTRLVAVNADGSNVKQLSTTSNAYSRGVQLGGGRVLDWLPDQDGAVLMSRVTLPDDHIGSRIGSSKEGLRVDRIDTRTLAATTLEEAIPEVIDYLSDGRGNVRIMALRMARGATQQDTGATGYSYRRKGTRRWEPLASYNHVTREGFLPIAVDPDLDLAYGFKKKDGRLALYTMALDGSRKEALVFARDEVDVDDVMTIGKRGRVVGTSYATDYRSGVYFDPVLEKLSASLSRALPRHPNLRFVDASVDEGKLLIFADSDTDAGVYYLYERESRHLETFLVARGALEDFTLAHVKPVSYPATDGTIVPGYLTLPVGKENAKGLPAIVMPHGGPGARDQWGFDWLAQFYAARGFAVLQPNFRGSAGYGDAWFQDNGFRSWPIAIGDVLDAGRWLVKEGIADPAKLAIVGWSYGGYAALQSAVVDSTVFKAVIAIAPVTDLAALKEERRGWTDFALVDEYIGDGPHVLDGSPAQNAAKIHVPVLLFHGTEDINVAYAQSQLMDKNLAAAGARHQLVTFEGLDHYLDDSAARIEMLRQSEAFLRQALAL